jgi:hypothetical protein
MTVTYFLDDTGLSAKRGPWTSSQNLLHATLIWCTRKGIGAFLHAERFNSTNSGSYVENA